MTKAQLIERIALRQNRLSTKDVDLAVKTIIDLITRALASGQRVEVRGFGSFSLRRRQARWARNPKTGKLVALGERWAPHFKPGQMMRDVVNNRAFFQSKLTHQFV